MAIPDASLHRLAAFLLLAATFPALPASAQVATVVVEENLRAEPNGVVIGRVLPGTPLSVEGRRDRWIQAEIEGWVWMASLQRSDRAGFDLVVAADGGENLRAEPQGTVLARLPEGTLLEELERITGWIHVRRTGWIWEESVEVDGGAATGAEEAGEAAPPEDDPPSQPTVVRSAGRELPVLSSPDGDTLARVLPGTDVQVLGREGSWARVQIEGWTWLPPGETVAGMDQETAPADLPEPTPEAVVERPEIYRGRLVTWRLQYISLERAERVRTDFYEGEPFLLTRPPDGDGSFVYVAVPRDRLEEVEGLTPLERIDVVGRIRTGASGLTGSPILDLVELRRSGGG